MKNKTEYLHIRITPDLKEQLQALAERDGRTMSNYVAYLVRREYEKIENSRE